MASHRYEHPKYLKTLPAEHAGGSCFSLRVEQAHVHKAVCDQYHQDYYEVTGKAVALFLSPGPGVDRLSAVIDGIGPAALLPV